MDGMVDDGGMVPDEYTNLVNPEEDTFTNPGLSPYKPKLRENQHLYEEREDAEDVELEQDQQEDNPFYLESNMLSALK